jgi:galactokinase
MSKKPKVKMMENIKQKVFDRYLDLFQKEPALMVFAPGRVNLIGEHTDYSDGFVFPVAINLGIVFAFSPRNDRLIKLYSLDFNQWLDQDISTFSKGDINWTEYIKGVGWALLESGFELKGFQGVLGGNLPIGAGLSSSAALEIAAAKSYCISSGIDLTNKNLAKIGLKAESDWIGLNVGIMDQLISATGKKGYAVMLDCRTLETNYIQIPQSIDFVVLDTMTRRTLSHSAYNTRQREVTHAAQILSVPALRDANFSLLEDKKEMMPERIYRRARHVISENRRVHEFSTAMKRNDLKELGLLLNDSHRSLKEDYQVSSKSLDVIVQLAQAQPGCFGARMTGAGFGGCALAMVEKAAINSFTKQVSLGFAADMGIEPREFTVQSSDGVHILD